MTHEKIATFRTRIIFDLITGRLTPGEIWSKKNYRLNVAPLRCEHGSTAASTVLKTLPHINAGGG